MNRGNRKGFIFEDDRDRRQFLRKLLEEQEVHDVKIVGGTLMRNHFHLAIVTPHGNLSDFMARLQGGYAQYFNWRHGHVGHVFQGRFRHVCIEGNVHLLTMLCYLFMNPVSAGIVDRLEAYKWSSYAASVGLAQAPSYLCLDWLESLYPRLSVSQAQMRLRQLMEQPKPVVAYIDAIDLNVDPDSIKQVIRSYTGEQLIASSLPRLYRTHLRPSLEQLLGEVGNDRELFIREARLTYGYRNAEIAGPLGLKPGTISKMFCADRRRHTLPVIDPAA
jgi:REP element-mobilizing transposase RayT